MKGKESTTWENQQLVNLGGAVVTGVSTGGVPVCTNVKKSTFAGVNRIRT